MPAMTRCCFEISTCSAVTVLAEGFPALFLTRVMPQTGQTPGRSLIIKGCIGQEYSPAFFLFAAEAVPAGAWFAARPANSQAARASPARMQMAPAAILLVISIPALPVFPSSLQLPVQFPRKEEQPAVADEEGVLGELVVDQGTGGR